MELAKKAGENKTVSGIVIFLSECYVEMGRVDEVMDLHKSLCDEIGRKSLDPDAVLEFARLLDKNSENSHALTILEHHLESIESSWEKREQCEAYGIISSL